LLKEKRFDKSAENTQTKNAQLKKGGAPMGFRGREGILNHGGVWKGLWGSKAAKRKGNSRRREGYKLKESKKLTQREGSGKRNIAWARSASSHEPGVVVPRCAVTCFCRRKESCFNRKNFLTHLGPRKSSREKSSSKTKEVP